MSRSDRSRHRPVFSKRVLSGALITGLGLVAVSRAQASGSHYFYDAQGRLVGLTAGSSQIKSYNYDPSDNRTNYQLKIPNVPVNSQSLQSTQDLLVDDNLVSGDGRFILVVQEDGNVVLAGPNGALWSTNTALTQGAYLLMQSDGNLVLFSAQGQALWTSGTSGNPGSQVILQTDGNLVIYNSGGAAIWSTGTSG